MLHLHSGTIIATERQNRRGDGAGEKFQQTSITQFKAPKKKSKKIRSSLVGREEKVDRVKKGKYGGGRCGKGEINREERRDLKLHASASRWRGA